MADRAGNRRDGRSAAARRRVGSECLRPRAAAMRDIKVEEELTFDYGKLHAEMHKLHDNVAGR